MRRTTNIWLNLDWISFVLYLLLVVLGWCNIYAAVYNEQHQSILDFSQRYGMQLIWIIASLVVGIMVLYIEVNFFTFFAYLIYFLALLLLLAVLFFAKEVNGAKSWFAIGSFRMQPSEFAKLAVCLALAKYLGGLTTKQMSLRTIFVSAAILVGPALLILMQPDAGSGLLFMAFVLVLYREGMPISILLFGALVIVLFFATLLTDKINVIIALILLSLFAFNLLRRKFLDFAISVLVFGFFILLFWAMRKYFHFNFSLLKITLMSSLAACIIYLLLLLRFKIKYALTLLVFLIGSIAFTLSVDFVFNHVLEKHQQRRVSILLGLESDPLGMGYNVNQSKIAIGSGGISGKGFLKGTQTKFNFVPQQSTDFIFCTIGEEWGFLGTFTILFLFGALIFRLLFLAERQRSAFSRIYGYGVACIFFIHVLVNVGMTIGLLPVIGIPLPFFSYGGSSLLAFTLLLFILLRLDGSRLEMLR
jgi:rod shape determining protein RodA